MRLAKLACLSLLLALIAGVGVAWSIASSSTPSR